ncbi:MAG: hypothetical protein ACYSU0_11585 [Planctomycetota bacterium]|jgi:hypothetical protein
MNRADATVLTGLLRDLARILKPFIDADEPGLLGWNGESYVAGDGAEGVNNKLDQKLTRVFEPFGTLVESAPGS